MSDTNDSNNPPAAPVEAAPAPESKPATFTQADVEAILAADREERGAESDPISRFKQATAGKAKVKQSAAQNSGGTNELTQTLQQLVALQVMALKPPAPPAPPKPMSFTEKLQSTDPELWLKRGNPNAWTAVDREQLVNHHTNELMKQGFRGDVAQEANERAASNIAQAGMRAMANIRIVPDGMVMNMPLSPRTFRK